MDQQKEAQWLVIDSDCNVENLNAYINKIKANNVTRVNIGPNCSITDFSFLTELESIQEIRMESRKPVDMSFVNGMKNLIKVSGDSCKVNVIIDNEKLSSLHCLWSPKFGISRNCLNLKQLSVVGCNDVERLWNDLRDLHDLDYLALMKGNMSTCECLTKQKKLTQFRLAYLSKLESLKGVEVLSETLTELWLQTGKKIVDYSPLGSLKNLETLVIANHSVIDNVSFLKNLKKLKSLRVIDTKITGTDFSILNTIPQVVLLHTGRDSLSHQG